MKKEYYNPGAKSYEPMMQNAITDVIGKVYTPYKCSNIARRRELIYNPLYKTRKKKNTNHRGRTFAYEPIGDNDLQFFKKEVKVREYHPVTHSETIDYSNYNSSKNFFRVGSVFKVLLKTLTQKIDQLLKWFGRRR